MLSRLYNIPSQRLSCYVASNYLLVSLISGRWGTSAAGWGVKVKIVNSYDFQKQSLFEMRMCCTVEEEEEYLLWGFSFVPDYVYMDIVKSVSRENNGDLLVSPYGVREK